MDMMFDFFAVNGPENSEMLQDACGAFGPPNLQVV